MVDLHKLEGDVLKFWEENQVYEKRKQANAGGKKFYFLQGPPYTSGRIHIGTAWNNCLKDMALRYKRMRGFNVWDRAGYDMHGLPTENAVQKKLGLKDKGEIEKFGVGNFVKECYNFSETHAEMMSKDLWKLGVWMDFPNAYKPITREFISGQWALAKKAHEQGRLYKGLKVMHWDPICETVLAKHELEYKQIKDDSIFLKFKRKGAEKEYFIVWTTTPWTIPFNLAIMVNPNVQYVRARVGDEVWVVAKDLLHVFVTGLLGKKYEVLEELSGMELEGIEYEHFLDELSEVYKKLKEKSKNVHTIVLSEEYVDTSSGTGLVHCAPGCGPEDFEVGKAYGIEPLNTLNEKGEFEGLPAFEGWRAKVDDGKFIELFEKKGALVAKTEIEHEYPCSWRTHEPVVFRLTEQWFLRVQDLVPRLLEMNKEVRWVPKKFSESYERWTENLRDNTITRQRYWGCPVPIWVNENDESDFLVVGNVEELEELTGKKFTDIELHRPFIDEVVIEKDGKRYKRIEDVFDVWLDSGTASWNCLYNRPELIEEYFPADLVLEGNEQTRLWFSVLQICSAIMFNSTSYKNVFVHGMIFDFEGMKMSKSLGNVISPDEVIAKHSVDVFRYYMCQAKAGENINFSWDEVKVKHRNLIILYNISRYLLDLARLNSSGALVDNTEGVEERWLNSLLNSTLKRVTELFESYNLDKTITEIERFFIQLSRDYIKIVRHKSDTSKAVFEALKESYVKLLKIFSPVAPFVTEAIWQELREEGIVSEESVHLTSWPEHDESKIDRKLEEEFELAFELIEKGLAERDRNKVGLRWPLAKATLFVSPSSEGRLRAEVLEVVKRQLNVKAIEVQSREESESSVELDFELTPELRREGLAREFIRRLQEQRKKHGLKKGEMIEVKVVEASEEMRSALEDFSDDIKSKCHISKFEFAEGDGCDAGARDSDGEWSARFDIKQNSARLVFKKV
ncbi:isoleucine--tRNA ligase [Candidatus Pacearchaeota archaeon]|nr:MAG: isoleucine--tRNA ligase [Candidatus Pacearchaeota archaeon]